MLAPQPVIHLIPTVPESTEGDEGVTEEETTEEVEEPTTVS